MKDLWEELNNEIPNYFDSISKEFSLDCVKINRLKTALVNNNFALIVGIDRFYIVIDYVYRDENNNLIKLNCDSFFSEKYDDSDRKELLDGKHASVAIINDMLVSKSGLKSKWQNMLTGDKEWIDDFKQSRWFLITNLSDDEEIVLDKIIN